MGETDGSNGPKDGTLERHALEERPRGCMRGPAAPRGHTRYPRRLRRLPLGGTGGRNIELAIYRQKGRIQDFIVCEQ